MKIIETERLYLIVMPPMANYRFKGHGKINEHY